MKGGGMTFEEFKNERNRLDRDLGMAQQGQDMKGPDTTKPIQQKLIRLWDEHPEHHERWNDYDKNTSGREREEEVSKAAMKAAMKAPAWGLTETEKKQQLDILEQRKKDADESGRDITELCLGPNGNVKLINGETKKISEIILNDVVQTANGFNKVVLVTNGTKKSICVVNNVVLTNRHPIKVNDKWCYPEDIVPVQQEEIDVYNFELERKDNFDENDHTIIVDGLICATLGCGPHIENAKPDADKKWGSGYWIKYN
jgi:hypothetical protein